MYSNRGTRKGNGTEEYRWRNSVVAMLVVAVLLVEFLCGTGHAEEDVKEMIRSTRALREKLLRDRYRPGYHFVTLEGRCSPFDVNGAMFWKGRYHMFYIFQNEKGHCWGHVSSTDLVHWRHHPTGLIGGVFSGNCFINKEGVPTMCFHDQQRKGNTMAVALDDELNEWKKLALITPATSPGDPHHDKYRSWDPYGWLEGNTYYAIFGGKRPAIARCDSLEGEWKYVGDLLAHSVEGGPFELKAGEPLKLRLFVDKSVVEVFANDRQAVMRRIYATRKDSLGVALFSKGGKTKVPEVRAWEMMPSNPY